METKGRLGKGRGGKKMTGSGESGVKGEGVEGFDVAKVHCIYRRNCFYEAHHCKP